MNRFYITDVFGFDKYTGNQLATVICGDRLTDLEMQKIAREINFSETTFILDETPQDNGYDIRIFTPKAEVDFAGHPVLGTAYIIQQHIIGLPVEKILLNCKVGQISISLPKPGEQNGILWMKQVEPIFGEQLLRKDLAAALNLDIKEIDDSCPIEQVSTGIPIIIVPLKSMDALKRARIDKEIYWNLIDKTWAKAILVFCPGGYQENHDLGVRVFVEFLGIPEDPATGSGAGCLAAYLVRNGYFEKDAIDITLGQGYEIDRPSQLHLRCSKENDQYTIHVGGRVVPIAEGKWF
ncbi:PhzF family phenazine biosynthesis protein [bacterium]|nr:PhzF family phenazine biosynthesis protein [bacterium]